MFGARVFLKRPSLYGVGQLRQRNIVLGHSRLHAPPAIGRIPRRGESARILNMNAGVHELAALHYAEAFDDMQLFGVRSLVTFDERLGVETDGVDDQRVALVVANRFSVPRRLDVRRMLVGEIDVADLVIGLPDHQDFLWPLHEEERMNAVQNETRNADRPTRRLRGKAALAGTNDLVVLAQILFRPGL